MLLTFNTWGNPSSIYYRGPWTPPLKIACLFLGFDPKMKSSRRQMWSHVLHTNSTHVLFSYRWKIAVHPTYDERCLLGLHKIWVGSQFFLAQEHHPSLLVCLLRKGAHISQIFWVGSPLIVLSFFGLDPC